MESVFSNDKKGIETVYRDFFIDYNKIPEKYCVKYPERYLMFGHWHNTGEFVLCESGKSEVLFDGNTYRLTSPYVIHYPPYLAHMQINDNSIPYMRYYMSIDPSYIDGDVSELPQSFFAFSLTADEYVRLHNYVSLLYEHYCEPPKKYNETQLTRRKYLLLLFLNELSPIISERQPGLLKSRYKYINEVCAYIINHISEKLSLTAIADKFFISRTKLTQDFRSAKNVSVGDYITAVRVSRSKILLRDGLPLAEIANRCGFSDSAYYIKVFEKLNHVTPTKFKKSHENYILFDKEDSCCL